VLHGALLDAELLAEVYLAMTRGQNSLTMDVGEEEVSEGEGKLELAPLAEVIVVAASEEELGLHEDVLNQLDKEARAAASGALNRRRRKRLQRRPDARQGLCRRPAAMSIKNEELFTKHLRRPKTLA
jgi:DNA polymerase III epsilon subunit-like protein